MHAYTVFKDVAIILVMAKIFGLLARKCKAPQVVGEIIAGLVIDKFGSRILQFVAMVAGTAVCYAFGTAWFCLVMNSTVIAALNICVFIFIPGDIAKMAIAITVGPMLRKRLNNAGLLEQRSGH